jgi:hypothetical protein
MVTNDLRDGRSRMMLISTLWNKLNVFNIPMTRRRRRRAPRFVHAMMSGDVGMDSVFGKSSFTPKIRTRRRTTKLHHKNASPCTNREGEMSRLSLSTKMAASRPNQRQDACGIGSRQAQARGCVTQEGMGSCVYCFVSTGGLSCVVLGLSCG